MAMGCLDANEIAEYVHRPGDLLGERVEQHIDACDMCRRLLSEAVRGSMGSLTTLSPSEGPRSTADPAQLEHKRCIARFEVLRVVGMGGCGVVLSAYDPQLDRAVAIKVLRSTVPAATGPGQS